MIQGDSVKATCGSVVGVWCSSQIVPYEVDRACPLASVLAMIYSHHGLVFYRRRQHARDSCAGQSSLTLKGCLLKRSQDTYNMHTFSHHVAPDQKSTITLAQPSLLVMGRSWPPVNFTVRRFFDPSAVVASSSVSVTDITASLVPRSSNTFPSFRPFATAPPSDEWRLASSHLLPISLQRSWPSWQRLADSRCG